MLWFSLFIAYSTTAIAAYSIKCLWSQWCDKATAAYREDIIQHISKAEREKYNKVFGVLHICLIRSQLLQSNGINCQHCHSLNESIRYVPDSRPYHLIIMPPTCSWQLQIYIFVTILCYLISNSWAKVLPIIRKFFEAENYVLCTCNAQFHHNLHIFLIFCSGMKCQERWRLLANDVIY